MKVLFVFPLIVAIIYASVKAGCTIDTTFLCIALIVAGYMANTE